MTNYKGIVRLTNGSHKIIRGGADMVAHTVHKIREARKSIFISEEKIYGIAVSLIVSIKFINEFTKQTYLEI